MSKDLKILIVDDEEAYCDVLDMVLQAEGYKTKKCIKSKEVLDILKTEDFDLIISDLIMPEMDGLSLLQEVKKVYPDIHFIMLTAYGTIENAVKAMRLGAFGYAIKGKDPEELLAEIQNITKLQLAQGKERKLEHQENEEYMLKSKSPAFNSLLAIATKAAKSDINILILGESGSGKEVIAQYIHNESEKGKDSFYATNCHTFSDSLLESELFGHEKGSFTGAVSTRIGRFEAAQSGTLFLDEIGDVPLATQAKLLRVIETKKINRIGSNNEIKVDFRLISATNKDLTKEIQQGTFREDLYYRLSTIVLQLPPLRQRKEDLPALIDYFVNKAKKNLGYEKVEMADEVIEFLMEYSYPGNIRELKNMIDRMIVLSDEGYIGVDSITPFQDKHENNSVEETLSTGYSLKDIRKEVEIKYIESILKKNQYNITKSAKELHISTRHLFNKIAEYGIKEPHEKGAEPHEK